MAFNNWAKFISSSFENLSILLRVSEANEVPISSHICSHGFIPQQMLSGEFSFRPIVKNEAVNKNSSDNYIPIMNSTNIFKLFKYCLFPIIVDAF